MTGQSAPRKRWHVTPWPWLGDTREDKAKRVALSYRELIFDITQGRCTDPAGDLHRLDQHWAQHGIYWPVPSQQILDPNEWVTAAELAHLIDKSPTDIYQWARRDKIQQRTSADGTPEYSIASAVAYKLARRQKRSGTTGLKT